MEKFDFINKICSIIQNHNTSLNENNVVYDFNILKKIDKVLYKDQEKKVITQIIMPSSFMEDTTYRGFLNYDLYNLFLIPYRIKLYYDDAIYDTVDTPTLLFDKKSHTIIINEINTKYALYDCYINYEENKCQSLNECKLNRLNKKFNFNCIDSYTKKNIEFNPQIHTKYTNIGYSAISSHNDVIYECTNKQFCKIEPNNDSKGEIARVILYIYTMYVWAKNKYKFSYLDQYSIKENNIFSKEKLDMYQQWNYNFPPTKKEVCQTIFIAKNIGYLNPFVMYFDGKSYVHDRNLFNYLFKESGSNNTRIIIAIISNNKIVDLVNCLQNRDFNIIKDFIFNKNFRNNLNKSLFEIYIKENIVISTPTKKGTTPPPTKKSQQQKKKIIYYQKYLKYKSKYLENRMA